MEMPVDVKKVLDEVSAVDEARTMPLSVSVYFDETAPGDVQAFVRQSFASASHHARVSLMYLDGRPFVPFEGDDMSVIVAGVSDAVGSCAEQLREAGVPVMVVTTLPHLVSDLAHACGHDIPAADLLSPAEQPTVSKAAVVAKAARNVAGAAADAQERGGKMQTIAGMASGAASTAADYIEAFAEEPAKVHEEYARASAEEAAAEPLELNDRLRASLAGRMGRWVVETCRAKKLAFALAFPFVRKPLALDAVSVTAMQNAGVGALVIIPGADMPIMTLNQSKMLLQIAASYGEDLGPARLKELAAVVCGGFALRSVARQIVSVVPVGGWAVKAGIGYSGTVAMGRAAIEYFEGGASLSRFTDAFGGARDKVMRVAAGKVATRAKSHGARTVERVRDAAVRAAGSAVSRAPREKAGSAAGVSAAGVGAE
ncbi:hypothetical protein [Adlercreutzia sp. ZJ138]|uniref:hypothetical protein n=1 Tax=Adlercreutzia sp. ZJ138 TaxID=2709405 RepID=UPI0013EBFD3E|nr:hypothetical protein [Adlercreutzia sp. ZJ138]